MHMLHRLPAALSVLMVAAATAADKPAPLTPKSLKGELTRKQTPEGYEALARRVVAMFGEKNLAEGKINPRVEENTYAWACRAKEPATLRPKGKEPRAFTRVGAGDVQVLVADLAEGTGFEYTVEAGGKTIGTGRVEHFTFGPDSQYQPGVPKGEITKLEFKDSKVFPGTVRDWWIYVPAQYDPKTPACVMVFQDGGAYVNPAGQFRVPVVFDNLIHKKEMPVTIGVFLNPGVFPNEKGAGGKARSNRSFEYDSLGDAYARFVIDEILPEVAKEYNLRTDAAGRAIGGISSGGICAFTAAWERPDAFSKVLSHVGSFTNIREGHNYAAWIRKTERKPIRVYLQDGSNDLDNVHGSWPLANQEMAASLKFMGYDHVFVYGEGFHSGKHGGAVLPDALRWLWREGEAKSGK
jgi:enterochelin esterase family protein